MAEERKPRDGEKAAQAAEQTADKGESRAKREISVTPRVVTIFALCVAVLIVLLNIDSVKKLFDSVFGTLAPVFAGITIAYVINPLYKFVTSRFAKRMTKRGKLPPEKIVKRSRGWALFLVMFIIIALIIALLFLIIPEFLENIQLLIERIPGLISDASSWLHGLIVSQDRELSPFMQNVADFVDNLGKNLTSLVTGDTFKDIISAATTGVISLASMVLNFLLALVVCVYALIERDKFIARFKKLTFSLFSPERANEVLSVSRYGNYVFGKYISGKLVTSLIDGLALFIFMRIFGIPYALLSSVIIAITNLIPFFGPFIGGGITGFIIVFTDPKKGLVFLIIFLILMQIDANIVSPMVLEDRTGVSKFWIAFALLLFGGMFGIPGMFFAVPLFAVLYYIIKVLVERRLIRKGLPVKSEPYFDVGALDPKTNEFIPAPQSPHLMRKPRLSFRAFLRALVGKKVPVQTPEDEVIPDPLSTPETPEAPEPETETEPEQKEEKNE